MGAHVIRAIVFDARVVSREEVVVEASGLEKWLSGNTGGSETRLVHYLVQMENLRLLVQEPPSPTPSTMLLPAVAEITGIGSQMCRYHEGPPGEPEKQVYCTRPAVTRAGFCRAHAGSPLALYWRCTSSDEEACRKLDHLWRGEEYVVYALDYGGTRIKIGLTRKWRLLWRIAEQPHVAAAVIARSNSIVEARRREKSLGRLVGASEGIGIRRTQRILSSTSILSSLAQERIARRLAEALHRIGVRGSFEAYTIVPKQEPRSYVAYSVIDEPSQLLRLGELVLEDYWAGLVLARTRTGSNRVLLDKKALQHIVLEGVLKTS